MNPLEITTEEIQGMLWDLHVQNTLLRREIVALRQQLQDIDGVSNGIGDAQQMLVERRKPNAKSEISQR